MAAIRRGRARGVCRLACGFTSCATWRAGPCGRFGGPYVGQTRMAPSAPPMASPRAPRFRCAAIPGDDSTPGGHAGRFTGCALRDGRKAVRRDQQSDDGRTFRELSRPNALGTLGRRPAPSARSNFRACRLNRIRTCLRSYGPRFQSARHQHIRPAIRAFCSVFPRPFSNLYYSSRGYRWPRRLRRAPGTGCGDAARVRNWSSRYARWRSGGRQPWCPCGSRRSTRCRTLDPHRGHCRRAQEPLNRCRTGIDKLR